MNYMEKGTGNSPKSLHYSRKIWWRFSFRGLVTASPHVDESTSTDSLLHHHTFEDAR